MKKRKSKARRVAPSLPALHLLSVAALAVLVRLLPWPAGGGSGTFWLLSAAFVAGSLLFYLLVRWVMRDPYPAFLSALVLLSLTAVWMPALTEWRPWAVLVPLSFALGALLGYWDTKLRKGKKTDFQLLAFAAVDGIVALGVIALTLLVCLRPVRLGMLPILSGFLIGAAAICTVLLAVSAFSRRQPWDLVLGMVLYAVVWKLLAFPGFESFL